MANGNQLPALPQAPQAEAQTPGPMGKTLSAGLTKLGMAFVGSAFTDSGSPELGQAFQQFGGEIADTLHMRWWQEEYDMFEKQYISKFKEGMHGLTDNRQQQLDLLNMGQLTDAQGKILDPASEEALRMRSNIERQTVLNMGSIIDELMGASGKYVNNPLVNQTIQNITTSTTDKIGQMLNPAMTIQNEQGVANVALARAQAANQKASAKTAGSGSIMKRNEMDLHELADDFNHDYDRLASYLATTTEGRKRLNQIWQSAEAEFKGLLIQQNPDLQANPDALATALAASQDELVNFAAGRIIKDTFGPTAANQLKTGSRGSQWYPEEPHESKPTVRTAITNADKTKLAKEFTSKALEQIHAYITKENPASLQEALDHIQEVWLPTYINQNIERNKATKGISSYVINYVTKYITENNNANIYSDIELARDKYKPKRSLMAQRASKPLMSRREGF
jgi:hypothetical protein